MILKFSDYRDKVMGCWAGKNIGGVLGEPFEGDRQVNKIDFYTQDLTQGPPPNDDLDLQIVWLAAVERYGRNVNASILGDYWLSFVIPNWVEYGMGKANLRAGFVPPMSGEVDNVYKDSCGCFIRSEIWACLAPGQPEIASRYAYEDAIVDHAGEGMYGEIFFAALQSAAFVETDRSTLIDIGLSYIPKESAVARCVQTALDCYADKVDFLEARKRIHNCAPGTFGIQKVGLSEIPQEQNEGMEIGAPGFDAPENIGFTIAAWLYGENDFGKCLCLAVSCGEDTDCTCATLGAILGIIAGAENLPKKWTEPLNDIIKTKCIDNTSHGMWIPKTVTEFTDRILRDTPAFLGIAYCDILAAGGYTVRCEEGEGLYCRSGDYLRLINGTGKDQRPSTAELVALSPYVARYDFTAFSMTVDYGDSVFFGRSQNRKIKVTVRNSYTMYQQQWVKLSLYVPDGVEVVGAASYLLPLNNLWGSQAEAVFEVNTEAYRETKLELIVDASLVGRHSDGCVKIVLARGESAPQ